MPVDQIGNPLLIGDLVSVQSGDQTFLGLVKEVHEPGSIGLGSNQMKMAGKVVVQLLDMSFQFSDKAPLILNITKVVKPPNFGKKES